ncbi:MAG TPA: hypothetical protein VFJ77_12040 [Gaiellaceae bacterium]|nr:hypothetical protein [Gaiellaceae bacterium]
MRRLTAWLAGAAGGLAAYRFLRRRPAAPAGEPPAQPDPRAEELRAKLEETRKPEPEAEAEETAPESPEERRRRVHEQGRSALDEMQRE